MVIFHSYVSLPEGIQFSGGFSKNGGIWTQWMNGGEEDSLGFMMIYERQVPVDLGLNKIGTAHESFSRHSLGSLGYPRCIQSPVVCCARIHKCMASSSTQLEYRMVCPWAQRG